MLETWSTLAALAEATARIELIGAIKPLLFNPLVFAKIAANIADIADGRLSVNVVSGWFLPELGGAGPRPCSTTTTATRTPGSGSTRVIDTVGGQARRHRRPRRPPAAHPARCPRDRPADVRRRRVRAGPGAGRRTRRRVLHQRPTAGSIPSTSSRTCARRPATRRSVAIRSVRVRRLPATPRRRRSRSWTICSRSSTPRRRPEISGGTDPKTQMYKVLADTSGSAPTAARWPAWSAATTRRRAHHSVPRRRNRALHAPVPAPGSRTGSVRREDHPEVPLMHKEIR